MKRIVSDKELNILTVIFGVLGGALFVVRALMN